MMKKILSVFLVLAIASVASAEAVWFEVDEADAKDHYAPSDIITINVYADFDVGSLYIGAIASNGGTAEATGDLHPMLNLLPDTGTIINEGGILISIVTGSINYMAPPAPALEILYSFEFHVPDVPESTYLIIDDYTDYGTTPPTYTSVSDPTGYMIIISDMTEAVIHVIPEPMTIVLLGLGGLFLRRRK
jgi:hypothetical protein